MNCKECGAPTANPNFCSRSCSAIYNNRNNHWRDVKGSRTQLGNCLECDAELEKSQKVYCSVSCQQKYRSDQLISLWKVTGKFSKAPVKRYLAEKVEGCWECGITNWNNKDIVLELEHIDGNSGNNTEENLSLLCPNCHSQTPTCKGANKGKGNGRHSRRERYTEGKSY